MKETIGSEKLKALPHLEFIQQSEHAQENPLIYKHGKDGCYVNGLKKGFEVQGPGCWECTFLFSSLAHSHFGGMFPLPVYIFPVV